MSQSVPTKTKTRDIVIGFFGWAVFSNLTCLLLLFSGLKIRIETIGVVIWLIAIISVIVLFVKKKVDLCIGVVANIIVNLGIWVFLYFPPRYNEIGEMIRNSILPFPSAMMLFFQ